jgi:hypothetical protein
MPTAPKNLRQYFKLQRLQNRVLRKTNTFTWPTHSPKLRVVSKLCTARYFITKLCRQQAEIMSMNIFCTLENAKLKTEKVRGLLNSVHTSSVQLKHMKPMWTYGIELWGCAR